MGNAHQRAVWLFFSPGNLVGLILSSAGPLESSCMELELEIWAQVFGSVLVVVGVHGARLISAKK